MYVTMKVGPHKAQGLHDSGASASLVSLTALKRLGLTHLVRKSDTHRLIGAFNGPAETSYGEITLPFYINRKLYRHSFICAELSKGTEVILGQDFWRGHNSMYLNKDGQARLYLEGQLVYQSPTPRELLSRQGVTGLVD